MRSISNLLCILALGLMTRAHAQLDTLWTCRLAPEGIPSLNGATLLADGGFAVAGSVALPGEDDDYLVARIAATGTIEWIRRLGDGNAFEQGMAVVELGNGNLVVAGGWGTSANTNYLSLLGLSPQGDSLWHASYGGSGQTKANDVVRLPNGNMGVIGYRLGAASHSDVWLLQCETDGDTVWSRSYGGEDTDTGQRLAYEPALGFVIAGQTRSMGAGDFDVWLMQTDAQGNTQQEALSGTEIRERSQGLALADTVRWVCGYRMNSSNSDYDGYIVRLRTTAQLQWAQSYTRGFANEQLRGIVPQEGGGALAVGHVGSTAATLPWVLVVDAAGNAHYSRVDSSFAQGAYQGILPVTGGGCMIFGNVVEGGVTRGYLMRTLPTTGVCGTVTARGTGLPLAGVQVSAVGTSSRGVTNANGWYVLAIPPGRHSLVANGGCVTTDTLHEVAVLPDSLTAVNLQLGEPRWERFPETSLNVEVYNRVTTTVPLVMRNSGSGAMAFSAIAQPVFPASPWLQVMPVTGVVAPQDSLVLSVRIQADTTDDGVFDYYGLLRIRVHSCPDSGLSLPVLATVLDAAERPGGLPRAFALHAPAPNPFNPATRLRFDVPHRASVRIAVYDVTGRLVGVLQNGPLDAGVHEVTFDGREVASGVYLVRMNAGEFSAVQRMVLVK